MSARAKAKTGTLTQQQLQSLGCVGKEMPQVQTAPPPAYPPLMLKSVMLETNSEQSFQIIWKEGFLTRIRDSAYYLKPNGMMDTDDDIIYQPKIFNELNKRKKEAQFNWLLMPSELQVISKTRKSAIRTTIAENVKLSKTANIEKRLKLLEEKERANDDVEVHTKSESDQEPEAEEIVDDEMDEENDYGNSYFDNGEAYNEEDDNMDDDPVY